MANRRIKATINNQYVQPLKLRTGRKLVVTPAANYNSILFTLKHRAINPSDYDVRLAAKFNSSNFDGIYITSMITRQGGSVTASDCAFEVYGISNDSLWTETLLTTVNGVADGSRFIASVPASAFSSIELDGSTSLSVKAVLNRQSDTFTNKIYVNHLGIFESLFLLKQEVEFLDLTKLDE